MTTPESGTDPFSTEPTEGALISPSDSTISDRHVDIGGDEEESHRLRNFAVVAGTGVAVVALVAVFSGETVDEGPTVTTLTGGEQNPVGVVVPGETQTTDTLVDTTFVEASGAYTPEIPAGVFDSVTELGYEWDENWAFAEIDGEMLPLATPGYPAPLTAHSPEGVLEQVQAAWEAMYNDWDSDGDGLYQAETSVPAEEYLMALGLSFDQAGNNDTTVQFRTLLSNRLSALAVHGSILDSSFPAEGPLGDIKSYTISGSFGIQLTNYMGRTLDSSGTIDLVISYINGMPSLTHEDLDGISFAAEEINNL